MEDTVNYPKSQVIQGCQEPGRTVGGEQWESEQSSICTYSCAPWLTLRPELRLLPDQLWH